MNEILLPTYKNIPDVGLYLDQTVRFLNEYTEQFNEELTASMVTNYVKLKIVPKAKGKMYDRKQIAMFMLVALCKKVLTMDQIRVIFSYISEDLEDVYETFRALLANEKVKDNGKKELVKKICSIIIEKKELDEYINNLN